MPKPILIISGVHPNEAVASCVAQHVTERLKNMGLDVHHLHLPYEITVLGNLDRVPSSTFDYCLFPDGCIDMDMTAKIGEEQIALAHSERLAFEFHNYPITFFSNRLGVAATTRSAEYRIGDIGPGCSEQYEIGYWQNRPPSGIDGKYLIEMPAHYVKVSSDCLSARLSALEELENEGHAFPDGTRDEMIRTYLMEEAQQSDPCNAQFFSGDFISLIGRFILSRATDNQQDDPSDGHH